ncbi:hypothetical protein AGR6A_pAt30020 [Agrobacterium sp. NCPPB 925]|nr:hypothetical protein AGR6A_pAt30020 [Agrobacterium sp. NCPPB 925]
MKLLRRPPLTFGVLSATELLQHAGLEYGGVYLAKCLKLFVYHDNLHRYIMASLFDGPFEPRQPDFNCTKAITTSACPNSQAASAGRNPTVSRFRRFFAVDRAIDRPKAAEMIEPHFRQIVLTGSWFNGSSRSFLTAHSRRVRR